MAPVPKFETSIPQARHCLLSFPRPNILLVTLNRAKGLNCINMEGHIELDAIWSWMASIPGYNPYDAEPNLICGIITGSGRAFSAGADLKEWNQTNTSGKKHGMLASGFAGLSRRAGRKPVIAAVNGICYGGGCEAIINCDMVLASRNATFALPEVKIGVVAQAGALPRLIRTVGRQRAMEMALTGRTLTAEEAKEWGLVNRVVEASGDGENSEVVKAAVELADMIAANSPDAVIVTRESVKIGWEGLGAEDGTRVTNDIWSPRLHGGDNLKEGVRAFVEKRKPNYKPAKL